MPHQRRRELSLDDWLVLCLVSEGPTYGLAIAGLLARDGRLGQVWHVHKSVIYRAVRRLEHLGLITISQKRPSKLGPDRAQLQVTPRAARPPRDGCASRSAIPGISAPS